MRFLKKREGGMRLQVAIDYITAYGISLVVVLMALYVIFSTGIFNSGVVPQQCTSAPSFLCASYLLNSTGVLAVQLGQTTGSTIYITGVACSGEQNATGNLPAFGNVHVTGSGVYYAPADPLVKTQLNSDSLSGYFYPYCYTSAGPAAQPLGDSFTGYLWINYTESNLPGNYITQVVSFTARSS